jgi:hypothetical protein
MLGPVSNQHRMTAIKQQVVLIIYSNPTPLALALCVSDAVLGIALNIHTWYTYTGTLVHSPAMTDMSPAVLAHRGTSHRPLCAVAAWRWHSTSALQNLATHTVPVL